MGQMAQEAIMQEDEISLTDIALKLWSRRGVLVVVPVLFMAAAAIYVLASMTAVALPTIHYVELRAIEKGQYPSGAIFSPKDLLAPEVIAEVARQVKMDAAALRRAINVEYGTPATSGIIAAFEQRLSQKGLSAADIERITADFEETLKRANERGLLITVDHTGLGLPPQSGAAIASLIPSVWSRIFSERYRIFVDKSLEGATARSELMGLQTTSQVLDAQDQLERVKKGLTTISLDARLSAIVNGSGQNADDLQREVNRFATLFFQPVYSYAFNSADEIARSYIRETEYKIAEIDKQIGNLNNTANDIVRLNNEGKAPSPPVTAAAGKTDSIQLGQDTLGQIISLANKASLTDYFRKTLEERHQLFVERTKLETRLARTKMQADVAGSSDFRKTASVALNKILLSYSNLLKIARERLRGRYSELYMSVGVPSVRGSAMPPKMLLMLTLAAFAGLFAAALIALLFPGKRKELRKTETGEEVGHIS